MRQRGYNVGWSSEARPEYPGFIFGCTNVHYLRQVLHHLCIHLPPLASPPHFACCCVQGHKGIIIHLGLCWYHPQCNRRKYRKKILIFYGGWVGWGGKGDVEQVLGGVGWVTQILGEACSINTIFLLIFYHFKFFFLSSTEISAGNWVTRCLRVDQKQQLEHAYFKWNNPGSVPLKRRG